MKIIVYYCGWILTWITRIIRLTRFAQWFPSIMLATSTVLNQLTQIRDFVSLLANLILELLNKANDFRKGFGHWVWGEERQIKFLLILPFLPKIPHHHSPRWPRECLLFAVPCVLLRYDGSDSCSFPPPVASRECGASDFYLLPPGH